METALPQRGSSFIPLQKQKLDRKSLKKKMAGTTHIVGHHDGEERLVVGVEGDVERGGLDHDEDGVEN